MTVTASRPKGPPLNALRAFEAAARLGGFLAAAEELSVTPGAVSQHIKALDAWAGAPLFERRAQGGGLTPLGADLARLSWLSDTAWPGDWAAWLAEVAPDLAVGSRPGYSLYALALEEAEHGAGVLIGHQVLVADRLAGGLVARLVELLRAQAPGGRS